MAEVATVAEERREGWREFECWREVGGVRRACFEGGGRQKVVVAEHQASVAFAAYVAIGTYYTAQRQGSTKLRKENN